MPFMIYASIFGGLLGWLMALLSIFLILLILVQRGRGGGLTGALGGPGGQSAFGSKAGDTFTRITFIVAGVWILLCAFTMFSLGNARNVVVPSASSELKNSRASGDSTTAPAGSSDDGPGITIPSGEDLLEGLTAPGGALSSETPEGSPSPEPGTTEPAESTPPVDATSAGQPAAPEATEPPVESGGQN